MLLENYKYEYAIESYMSLRERLKQELAGIPSNFVVLILANKEKFDSVNSDILSIFTNEMQLRGGYISIEGSISEALSQLKKSNADISKITFVNCTGREERLDCRLIQASHDLTSLSIALEKVLENKSHKFLVLDSLNRLIAENDYIAMVAFMQSFSMNTRVKGIGNIIIAVDDPKNMQEIEDLSEFCDKVIDLT